MSFLELLQPQGDKANLNEIIEARKLLPKHVTKAIPSCLYDDEGSLDEEVLVILSCVRARRENKDITQSEVGERIGNETSDLLRPIIKELIYFYTTNTREEVEERFATAEAEETEAQETQEANAEDWNDTTVPLE